MDSALEKLQQAVEDAMEGLSDEDLSWHPPGKWCAAEVLEHLYLTYGDLASEVPNPSGGWTWLHAGGTEIAASCTAARSASGKSSG